MWGDTGEACAVASRNASIIATYRLSVPQMTSAPRSTIKRGTYSFLHTLALRSLCNFPFAVDHEVTDANGEVIDYESRDTITEPLLTKSSTNPTIYARMVGNHKVAFPKLLAAPHPYHLRNGFPFAHSFHATIVEGRLLNFSHPDFEPTIADFLSYLDVLLSTCSPCL